MEQFQLLRGNVVLGIVTLDAAECDFPWRGGWLEPLPEFAEVEPLFQEWEQLLEAEEFGEKSETIFNQIASPGIQMRPLDGSQPHEVQGLRIDHEKRVVWR